MLWPSPSIDPLIGQRRRVSSYDVSGGNRDYVRLPPGGSHRILQHGGSPGRIVRLWLTVNSDDPGYLEKVRVNFSFDGMAAVRDVPLGALTATGPWAVNDIVSEFVDVMRGRLMNRETAGAGLGSFNLSWPMPFNDQCTLEFLNGTSCELMMFYSVEYFTGLATDEQVLVFHATHNRSSPTTPHAPPDCSNDPDRSGPIVHEETKNLSREHNHVLADIRNHRGFYAGTFLAVESHPDREGKWYEGDDMFFVDGDDWPPALHGTGTEDYFGMAWGIHRKYQARDHGVSHYERGITGHDRYYDGRFGIYRWHVRDPIPFTRSLHASIEAGHANDCRQYYESVAFWYGRPL